MTPAKAEALGRAWIAAGGGWRDGMLDGHTGHRIALGPDGESYTVRKSDGQSWPDLRDPATRGAALDVVRERWGDPLVCVIGTIDHPCYIGITTAPRTDWRIDAWTADVSDLHGYDSEAAALLAALVAALGVKP